jgi:hypothetical protein
MYLNFQKKKKKKSPLAKVQKIASEMSTLHILHFNSDWGRFMYLDFGFTFIEKKNPCYTNENLL